MGSSSIYRNFSVIAVACLFLSLLSMFGIAVVIGIQLSGELILGTALVLVEATLAISETRGHSREMPTNISGDKIGTSGTPLTLGATQLIEIEPPEPERE